MAILEIDSWLAELAISPVSAFYPSLPAKQLGLGIGEVVERLIELVKVKYLELRWEIRCPECGSTLLRGKAGDMVPDSIFCERCDERWSVDPDQVFLYFSFTDEYRETQKRLHERIVKKNESSRDNSGMQGPAGTVISLGDLKRELTSSSEPAMILVVQNLEQMIVGSGIAQKSVTINNRDPELLKAYAELQQNHIDASILLSSKGLKNAIDQLAGSTDAEEQQSLIHKIKSSFESLSSFAVKSTALLKFLGTAYQIVKPFAQQHGYDLPDIPF